MHYRDKIRAVLESEERRVFQKLDSPRKIQDFLDTLPINFELKCETYMSPRRVLREKTAHCFEGALFAAAVVAYHGGEPLLMDIQTVRDDDDHVVTLTRVGKYWGSISKTNHAILRYRDPIYRDSREVAMSYFNEYSLNDGSKTMRAFSTPFDLSRYAPEKWVTAEEDLFWLADKVDSIRHFPTVPKNYVRKLRKTDVIERTILELEEWHRDGAKNSWTCKND
jgi:hypothetical protein